jgi:hypothetical protein
MMPLTPSYGDQHAGPVISLYSKAEQSVLRWIATSLAAEKGYGPTWFQRTLLWLPRFRHGVAKIVAELDAESRARVTRALMSAWRDGATAARTDLPHIARHVDEAAARDLVEQVTAALAVAHRQIPEAAETIYRKTVAESSHDAGAGSEYDRRTLTQRVLDRFARLGITGFVDRHNRRYDLVSYAETTVRTAISHAEVESYTQQLTDNGYDLIIVSDVPGSCPLCTPFEGQILSISGGIAGAITRDTATGQAIPANVMCSLDQARERGLFHRGCRHTIGVWTPDDPAPPAAIRLSDSVREARRQQSALVRRSRVRQRVAAARIAVHR